jgi:FKBP-type peptidyl-prolyl cis-trans isomerase
MDRGTLIRDLAIIAVMIIAGTLIFLVINDPNSPSNDMTTETPQNQATQEPASQGTVNIEIVREGTGVQAKNGSIVRVHYQGTLEDGTVFDENTGDDPPFTFRLGAGEVIPGWEIGILDMKVGEIRVLSIPPELAYGTSGFPPVIPPSATLRFEVELLEVL